MSVYAEVARRSISLASLDGTTNKGPTVGIYTGSGDASIVCHLADDPDTAVTFSNPAAGVVLPICVCKWVSGPTGAVGLVV